MLAALGPWSLAAAEEPAKSIQVTLIGITSHNDFEEIQAALSRAEGVDKVSIDTEAPGLVTLKVQFSGETKDLLEKLSTVFNQKYSIAEKHLPSGGREIRIAKASTLMKGRL